MSRQSIPILSLTVTAAAALTAHRFVGATGGAPAGAANALGVARSDAATGEDVTVDVLGTSVVEAGGVLGAGVPVEVAADGRAVVNTAGIMVGRVAPGEAVAIAAGELFEIVLIPN